MVVDQYNRLLMKTPNWTHNPLVLRCDGISVEFAKQPVHFGCTDIVDRRGKVIIADPWKRMIPIFQTIDFTVVFVLDCQLNSTYTLILIFATKRFKKAAKTIFRTYTVSRKGELIVHFNKIKVLRHIGLSIKISWITLCQKAGRVRYSYYK